MADNGQDAVAAFIAKWKGVQASELATAQTFAIDLCHLLGVPTPHATPEQDYMFERPISFRHGDGSTSTGRIDLYRRGAFVLESKKLRGNTQARGFDEALLRARSQAEAYARALPASEGRPPFVVVVDVGHRIELYAEFSRSGATYTPYPDPRSHRIALDDLREDAVRERLRRVWLDPLSLDPSREAARVTRAIAAQLAELAKSLEQAGHAADSVAQFLMRCLFTMFAEDVRLLPADSFRDLLARHAAQPDVAMRMLAQLWRDMDTGGFSAVLAGDVLRFNGKLFKTPDTLPLDRPQLQLLLDAARADWKHVEPAIFGTLLERALEPGERHKLGAHYTPRAYVERLVLPTVIEPLRAEWSDAQAAALTLAAEGKRDEAAVELRRFHHRLCGVRVLDPACGSGNFLYVTLEHLKRLEGEVLNALDELGDRQTGLALAGERADAAAGETVDPHNLIGIELNPRAAAIAEVVLWIGYLQWHFRTRGNVNPPVPVIRDFRNIENRDAVLAYDAVETVTDARGIPVTRWDGETTKVSPVTGEKVPDDSARIPLLRYVNPRKAAWPQADFVVGNPPFIGNKRMRAALGDGYVEALRGAWPDVPESADFVMYWWHHAAQLTRRGALQRFGLITTNSIRQAFNRRVIEQAMAPAKPMNATARSDVAVPLPPPAGEGRDGGAPRSGARGDEPISLVFAIPDHPWVDTADGAAVRIGMTVAAQGALSGVLRETSNEVALGDGESNVDLTSRTGVIQADLRIGAMVASASPLKSNLGLCWQGCKLVGSHFQIDEEKRNHFLFSDPASARMLPMYTSGSDLMQKREVRYVVDTFGLEEDELRQKHPALYQHLYSYVYPERLQNNDRTFRERWWQMGRPRPEMRTALAGLDRYIVTSEVSKHRVFTMLQWPEDLIDGGVVAIASRDFSVLGVASSQVHVTWSLAAAGTLEDRPRYHTTKSFDPFPFPDFHTLDRFSGPSGGCTVTHPDGTVQHVGPIGEYPSVAIGNLAEQLDAHRKRQQAAHPGLTLTGMYNVLDKLRSGEPLGAKERTIHEQGLVSVLRQLHDELDAAVLAAYGWSDLLPLLRVAHGNVPPGVPVGEVARIGTPHPGNTPPARGPRYRMSDDDAPAVVPATREEAKRLFDDAILDRLVALNAERAAEEARGHVRWLRPDFQNPQARPADAIPTQATLDTTSDDTDGAADATTPARDRDAGTAKAKPLPWPKDPVDQVRAVADLLQSSPVPLTLDDIAARFTARGPWKKRLPQLLEMLVALGRAQQTEAGYAAA